MSIKLNRVKDNALTSTAIKKATSRTKANLTALTILAHRLPPFHHAWNQIFHLSKQPQCEVAIELCCGYSPKIGIALHQAALVHRMGYVDMSYSALRTCRQLVNNLAPDCNSFFLNNSLATLSYQQPFNLIAGNHILDDLLIQQYLEYIDKSFNDAYQTQAGFVSLINKVVPYYRDNADSFLSGLAHDFAKLVAHHGRIILSDYVSYYENCYGIVDWPKLRFFLTDELSKHLLRMGFRKITLDSIPSIFNRVHIWEKHD